MYLSLLERIIDLFSPRYCPSCDKRLMGTEEMLCATCLLGLPITSTWEDPYENKMAKMFWGRIPIERCVALFYYHSHSYPSNIIYALKYHHRPDAGVYLGHLIGSKGLETNFFDGIDAIIPIPITPKRRKQRGYNQSEMIARGIQEKIAKNIQEKITKGIQGGIIDKGIQGAKTPPIITDAVRRIVFTESQTQKTRMGRLENVENVFQLSDFYHDTDGKHPISDLAGKHLLLIDDVCTTGATLVSCCQELEKAGKMKFSIATVGWATE